MLRTKVLCVFHVVEKLMTSHVWKLYCCNQFVSKYRFDAALCSVAHLNKLYDQVPEQFTPLLPRFANMLKISGGISGEKMMTAQLFAEIAKKNPQVLTHLLYCFNADV